MSEQGNDHELVRRVQAGDKRAFDALVHKYQHKIIKLILRYVSNPEAAQDVAQDAFLKAYRGLAAFRGESAFYTWLYRIAINTAKNYLVAEGRRAPEVEIDAHESETFNEFPALRDYGTPERVALSDEIERTVYHAIKNLPEDLKTAITLRELEGLSYEEIAQAMDCPIGTVRSRIFRAREAIDRELKELLD